MKLQLHVFLNSSETCIRENPLMVQDADMTIVCQLARVRWQHVSEIGYLFENERARVLIFSTKLRKDLHILYLSSTPITSFSSQLTFLHKLSCHSSKFLNQTLGLMSDTVSLGDPKKFFFIKIFVSHF